MSSNEPPSSTPPDRQKLIVEPRSLPEESAPTVQPFQELNQNAASADTAQVEPAKQGIRPRAVPERKYGEMTDFGLMDEQEAKSMREAMRLMLEEGHTREEAAARLKIEPLKIRHWENAYHEFLQKNLNEGDYHDTDAQLRDLPPEAKARFNENWDEVVENYTERRVKLGPIRSKLMSFPLTKWMFRNEYGQIDYASLAGVGVAIIGLAIAISFMIESPTQANQGATEEKFVISTRVRPVEHDGKAAAELILAFHQTPTWEDKLPFVRNPEEVRPRMKEWYERFPEQVTYARVGFIADQSIAEAGRNYLLSAVQVHKTIEAEEATPFYMALERTEDGYLIDWEVSSGYQEMPLDEFRATRPTEPQELRFTIKNSDYYNYGFDDPEKYVVFEASYMNMDRPFFLYAPAELAEAKELKSLLEVKDSVGVVVKVRYPENAPADDQIELVELVARGWFKEY